MLMALPANMNLSSDYVPGYGVSNSRSFSNSPVSRRSLAVLPCSSCLVHKLHFQNGHVKCAPKKVSFVCRASSGRRNPDFSRNNKHGGFRGRNRRIEERDGFDGLEDSEMLSPKNGPILSLSNSPKFQATSSPGPREKEIVELFRKVQAQLRARAAAKKEDKKIEDASKGQGKESETVDSLLKLLRKHSGEQNKKKVTNFNSQGINSEQRQGDSVDRQDHNPNHFDSRDKDHNATPFTRPASSFRRNSPVPRYKSQTSYSNDAIFDQASSYSVTWTHKKDPVEEPEEPEYEPEAEYEAEPEYEPHPGPGLSILDSEPELKAESFYQEEDEEDQDVVLDELSDDESLNVEEETVKDEEDLSALKLTELRAIAKSRGLKGVSKMKKAELVDLLGRNQA